MNEGCFEGGDVFIELDDFVSEELNLLQLKLIVSLANLLLLNQLEFLLVDNVFGYLLLCFVLLLQVDFVVYIFEYLFFLLHLVCLRLNCLLLFLELINVFDDAVVELES